MLPPAGHGVAEAGVELLDGRRAAGPALADVMDTATRRWAGFGLLLLLALLAIARSAVGTRLDSFTVDEPWHIVAGTTYARGGGFQLNPEHPPLVKLWVGAVMPGSLRLRPPKALREKAQERDWVEETLFYDNDAGTIQQRARLAMWAFHGLLLVTLGLLLWRAFGLPWAVGSLLFLAIDPTVAAHLPVVMTDLPLALALAIAAIAAGLLAATWQWRWAVALGLAMGIALATKHSALAGLAGLGLGLLLVAQLGWRRGEGRKRHAQLGCVALLAVLVLWSHYGFRFHAGSDGSDAFNRPIAAKIGELHLLHWRDGLSFADAHQLLPRAYLWGLADTVRTGVEGRGIGMHLVWGKLYYGDPPWFSWPAILAAKLPLALLAMLLAGLPLLARRALPASARWSAAAIVLACGFHMAALVGSNGIWGGVRHAMPVIAGASVLAGGVLAWAWQRRSRPALAAVAALYLAAFAMTIREPRAWEYHNELVGGTREAYRYFQNEGIDLGQRFHELRAFHDRHIAGSGEPLYVDYWVGEEQMRAAKLSHRRRVESLQDTNVAGHYRGWFVYPMVETLPWPQWDWDPKVVFKDMRLVARLGYIGIWHGEMTRPQTRASALANEVGEYIYQRNGDDWALVAARLEEVMAQLPGKVDAGVELGNAWLRLGERDKAVRAYMGLLEQEKVPLAPDLAAELRRHIGVVRSAPDLAKVEPLRNPWLE